MKTGYEEPIKFFTDADLLENSHYKYKHLLKKLVLTLSKSRVKVFTYNLILTKYPEITKSFYGTVPESFKAEIDYSKLDMNILKIRVLTFSTSNCYSNRILN
jgi:hypothetical protein